MTNLEIAHKRGVATFETSKELDWQGETNFYWVESDNSIELHSYSEYLANYVFNEAKQHTEYMREMKEIEKCMPANIPNKNSNSRLEQGYSSAFSIIATMLGKDTSDFFVQPDYDKIIGIPAPQMHEIAPLLPMELSNKKAKDFIKKYLAEMKINYYDSQFLRFTSVIDPSYSGLCYNLIDYDESITVFESEIKNNHFAQAYAELYLKLKKAKLI